MHAHHEDVSYDDGGGAGLWEGGDQLPQPETAVRMEGVPARRRGLRPRRRPLGRNLGFKLGLELHEDGLRGLQVPGQCMNLEEQLFG